ALGMPAWKVERAQRQARGWTPDALVDAMRVAADCNAAVKGGSEDRGTRLSGRSSPWRRRETEAVRGEPRPSAAPDFPVRADASAELVGGGHAPVASGTGPGR